MCRNETVVAPRDMTDSRKPNLRVCLRSVRGLPRATRAHATHRTIPPPQAMRIGRILALGLTALVLPALASCEDATGPVPGDQLTFIRQAPGSPALEAQQITFWAVKGESQQIELRYVNGYDCVEFRLDGASLLRRPDGSLIRDGDSVQITIRVVDPALYNFEFLPAGLRFDSGHPAELKISYAYANHDFNGDGVIDSRDEDFAFGIWRQESTSSGWNRLTTLVDADIEEARTDLFGFSKFAMAGE